MEKHLSNTQVDRLGDRLRLGDVGEAELSLLDEYRRTFEPAYDLVIERVHRITGLPVSGRPAKSTTSIVEKLKRESIRLSQMQDIAGCRVVVDDLAEQDRTREAIAAAFDDVTVLDRRRKSSYGYRAVHSVVREGGKTIEVQIRTALQHAWAELCEKSADVHDPAIKYGGGPESLRASLNEMSRSIEVMEVAEADLVLAGNVVEAQRWRANRKQFLSFIQLLIKVPTDRS